MQLGWVDFSKEDRQKVFDVMNLLQQKGAVDELGIGIIRDAFANYFFPGTSTIQTRAKYFLMVPYVLKEVVEGSSKKTSGKIMDEIDKREKACGIALKEANPEEDGVIGRRVLPKGWVARKPSEIYWSGIRTFHIFKIDQMSISDYVNYSLYQKSLKKSNKLGNLGDDGSDAEKDDLDAGDMKNFVFWDLPPYKADWFDHLTIDLTQDEAVYLKNQIEKSTPGTLLQFILKNHIDLDEYTSFETMTADLKDKVDPDLAYMMQLACAFSKLVYLARVRYNVILSEGKNEEANGRWDEIKDYLSMWISVDLDAVYQRLEITKADTRIFLTHLQELLMANDIEAVDAWIRKREISLKGINRAKLNRGGEFALDEWVGGYELDYRFFNARRIIKDIYQGEEKIDV